jgi:hypothetical protein
MMSAVVSSAMVDAAVGVARRAASEMGVSLDDLDEPFVKYFMSSADGLRDSFEAVCGKVTADGNGHGKIVLKEGGDLLGAYIKLLSLGTMSVESSSASGESTRIANDLGKLKLAAILYHDDNDEWPTPGDVGKLDGYLDEPIVGSGRYEKVIIGPEFKDEGMAVRSNIGVTLGAKDGTERIRKSLESKASGRHLLRNAEGLEPYDGDSMSVFINMR